MRLIDANALHKEISEWPESVMYKDWVQAAIANAQTITPPTNDPLTLEELREMDGEPVWTVTIGLEGSGRWELCTCEMITACPIHKVLRCVASNGEVTDYELGTYGKTWLAYRRRPEVGTV